MRGSERHKIILSAVNAQPVASVGDLVELTGCSEATIRRDISKLHVQGKLRRVRGGAEALNPPTQGGLIGRPFSVNEAINTKLKRAIAKAAVEMCADGDSIIINGGTTTYQMVFALTNRRCQVFTNSFPIASHLLTHSRNSVIVPGGTIYREQNIILSPFESDVTRHFHARRMFMGAQGIGSHGVTEADPLLIQAENKLLNQAEELLVLADSTKFRQRSSLILCKLERVHTIITDNGIAEEDRQMIADHGVNLVIADAMADTLEIPTSSVA